MKNVVIPNGTSENFQVFYPLFTSISNKNAGNLSPLVHCLFGRQLTTVVLPIEWKGRNKARWKVEGNSS